MLKKILLADRIYLYAFLLIAVALLLKEVDLTIGRPAHWQELTPVQQQQVEQYILQNFIDPGGKNHAPDFSFVCFDGHSSGLDHLNTR